MGSILNLFIYFIACIIALPLLATWLVYIVSKRIYKHTWMAIHTAVNWTTLFYILSVLTILHTFYGRSFIGFIGVILFLMLSIIIFVQWKSRHEVVIVRAVKILWRASFLVFSLAYICLAILGVVYKIFY